MAEEAMMNVFLSNTTLDNEPLQDALNAWSSASLEADLERDLGYLAIYEDGAEAGLDVDRWQTVDAFHEAMRLEHSTPLTVGVGFRKSMWAMRHAMDLYVDGQRALVQANLDPRMDARTDLLVAPWERATLRDLIGS